MEQAGKGKEDLIKRFEGYYKGEDHFFGVDPSGGVAKALPFLAPGRVLDLGCGDGRNALFLARNGFHVTAVDITPTAVNHLTRYAARAGLTSYIKTVVADIEAYDIEGPFENILSTYTLHFLPKESFPAILNRIMQATGAGGINVIEDFTQEGPLYKVDSPGYFLQNGELRSIYEGQGWTVLYYSEHTVTTKATDEQGNHYQQGAASIVAAKTA